MGEIRDSCRVFFEACADITCHILIFYRCCEPHSLCSRWGDDFPAVRLRMQADCGVDAKSEELPPLRLPVPFSLSEYDGVTAHDSSELFRTIYFRRENIFRRIYSHCSRQDSGPVNGKPAGIPPADGCFRIVRYWYGKLTILW
jgi:hypothetical protein